MTVKPLGDGRYLVTKGTGACFALTLDEAAAIYAMIVEELETQDEALYVQQETEQ